MEEIAGSISNIVRWASRPEVRRAMSGDDGVLLSPTEQWLLDHIARCGPLRMSDLAAWQHVDRSTITAQIGRLEARALVRRVHSDTDRRTVRVEATEAGRDAIASAQRYAVSRFAALVSGWDEADRRRFAQLLAAFTAGLN